MPSSQTDFSPTIVFLNVPPKTFVGINLISFNSAPDFHGIANPPRGLSFIYTGADASLSIRHGLWLSTATSRLFVLKWNTGTESLDLLSNNEPEAHAAAQSLSTGSSLGIIEYDALRDANANISANDSSTGNAWQALTAHINASVCERILGRPWSLTSISSAPQDDEHIPGLNATETRSVLSSQDIAPLNLVHINLKQTWPEEAIGSERTEKARDRSWYLSQLVDTLSDGGDRRTGAQELLGELELCFIGVLTLANYSCLEQWKRILGVLLTCKKALGEVEEYFVGALTVLRVQLGRVEDVEGGMFEMGDEMGSAWLRAALDGFRRNVDEVIVDNDSKLKKTLADLEKWLEEKYGWVDRRNVVRRGMVQLEDGEMVEMQMDDEYDENDETGEWAPTIVET